METNITRLVEYVKCFDKDQKIAILHHLLTRNEGTIEDISKTLSIKSSTVYKYLRQMMKTGVVGQRKLSGKKGKLVFYAETISFSVDSNRIKNILGLEKNEKRLIIFDVDDTLVRRTDIPEELAFAGRNAIKEAKKLLQDKGIPISMPPDILFSADWIHGKYGNSIMWYINMWLSVAGVPDGNVKEILVKKYVKEYYKNIELSSLNCALFKDVKPFLEKNYSSTYFAAMSNSSKKTLMELFRINNILNYFTKEGTLLIVGGDEIVKSSEAVNHLIKISGIDIKNTFVIGDTGGDMKAAFEAGVYTSKMYAISRGITPLESLKCIMPRIKIIGALSDILNI